jgi:hypothetical protein
MGLTHQKANLFFVSLLRGNVFHYTDEMVD